MAILGASWRWSELRALEELVLDAPQREARLERLRQVLEVEELVYLATCNRVEILVLRPPPGSGRPALRELRRRAFAELTGRDPAAGESARMLRLWQGEGALEHLLLVACGLDSAEVGEREIRGQLRVAHAEAETFGLSGPRLDWAVDRALATARRVEQCTGLTRGRRSLAGVGMQAVEAHLEVSPGSAVLVGVSAMTERCGKRLVGNGVSCLVVNRSAERGEALARRLGARWRPLGDFLSAPEPCSVLISATGSSQPVFRRAALQQLRATADPPPFLVDFGVPPDVDPRAAAAMEFERLGMEEMTRKAAAHQDSRRSEVACAREEVDRALGELRDEVAETTMGPVAAAISRRYRETAQAGAERLVRRQLSHLDPDERQAIEKFALNLAKRLAHLPVVGLRAVAREMGPEAVETFLAAAGDPRIPTSDMEQVS